MVLLEWFWIVDKFIEMLNYGLVDESQENRLKQEIDNEQRFNFVLSFNRLSVFSLRKKRI